LDPSNLAGCIGTKEIVASLAGFLHRRDRSRDTVLFPDVSYPTYAMSAELAGLRAVAVPALFADGTGVDLSQVSEGDAERALVLWVNSPSNPTGGLSDLDAAASWGRIHDVPVFSDECYAEFTWAGPRRSILESGPSGVVAVHSLSKRSNMAGLRVGFFAGDPELVHYLRDVRQHAGLMVPGPVQAAGAVAFSDDSHVEIQRGRYSERLAFFATVLTNAGFSAELPSGGFYLWVKAPERFDDAWEAAGYLARTGGLLVAPGDLYGERGKGHLRIATVQPTSRLELVAERLEAASRSC
jgi:aspartate/methionine/tyrosine aminotransferase